MRGNPKQMLLIAKDGKEVLDIDLFCGHRICPICNRRMVRRKRHDIHSFIESYRHPRLMGLTTANRPNLTADWIRQINFWFAESKKYLGKSRNRDFYEYIIRESDWTEDKKAREIENLRRFMPEKKAKYSLGRYVLVFEIQHHKKGDEIRDRKTRKLLGYYDQNCWNVHLHILYDGDYISAVILSHVWKHVSDGENYIVDVRQDSLLKDKHRAVNYVTKYLTKCCFRSNDPNLLIEFYKAIRGFRLSRIVGDRLDARVPKYTPLFRYLAAKGMDFYLIQQKESTIRSNMEQEGVRKFEVLGAGV